MIRRLRWKFVAINMVLVALVLGVLIGVVMLSTKNSLYSDSMSALQQALTLSPDDNYGADSDSSTTGLFGQEKVQLPYLTIQTTRDNKVLVIGNQFFDLNDETALIEVINCALQDEDASGVIQTSGYSVRYLRENNISGYRIAFVDMTQETSTLTALATNMVFIGLGALAVFFVISLILARWAVRPVEKSWKQQRQFVSDASHELKTPLTVILSNLDMLDAYCDDEEKQRSWMGNVRTASEQMRTLVEELLVLARSDNNAAQQMNSVLCPFSELVENELLLFEPIAYERGKRMEEHIDENVFVNGDASMLRRIVDIYLDNACKYAPQDTTIHVTLKNEGKRVLFSVYSAGEPIATEQLPHLFERFYRVDDSRSEEGYGLGLSIAWELAKLHRGKVWAESNPMGNAFFFTMPRTKETQVPTSVPAIENT